MSTKMINETKIVDARRFHIEFIYDGAPHYAEGEIVGSGNELYFVIRFIEGGSKCVTHKTATVKVNLDTMNIVIFSNDKWDSNEKKVESYSIFRIVVEVYLEENKWQMK